MGVIGAGIGGASAAYEFEMAEDLHRAGESQAAGQYKLINDPAAARKEYIWGIVNLCLAGVDALLAGAEVVKIGRIVNLFSTTNDGLRVISKMDNLDQAVRIFGKLDDIEDGAAFIRKLESAGDDAVEAMMRTVATIDDDMLGNAIVAINRFDDIDVASDVIANYGNNNDFIRILGSVNDKGFEALSRADDWDSIARMIRNSENPDNLIQYIDEADYIIEGGTKGSWNRVLNGGLEPDSNYFVNGRYIYHTDETGRVSKVSGELHLNSADRNIYQQQRAVGVKDGITGQDDGGHLIASMFDGPGEQINYVPQSAVQNRAGGDWYDLEQTWKKALGNNQKVEVDIQMVYSEASKRPDGFIVNYSVDGGQPISRRITNN